MGLTDENIICKQCNSNITSTKYVKCNKCNSNYHLSQFCSMTEKIYNTTYGDKKNEWRCHQCKGRSKSESNNAYQTVVFDDVSQQKKQRQYDDEDNESNSSSKKFKEAITLGSLNSGLFSVQSELKDIKTSIEMLNNTVSANNAQNSNIMEELKNSIQAMATSITTLATQVSDLYERENKQDKKIEQIDQTVNKIDQALIKNNIEIKNVSNKDISATEIIKTIAASVDVEITNFDINNAYRVKKADNKAIIEFTTLNKKRELMSKIQRHRIDANVINTDANDNKFIYINDQLTSYNRRLLWTAKTKAKECNWKFVWVRSGSICARKNENSQLIMITNTADIELINNSN